MTFTYDPSKLSTDKTMEIRFLLGDTTEDGHFLEDEEIAYAIAKWEPLYNSTEYVASVLATDIAARYAQEASYSADGVSISLGPVGDQFRKLAADLRQQYKNLLVGGSPDVGGISPYEQRPDDVKNFAFGVDMHDDPEAGQQDYGDTSTYRNRYYDGDIGSVPTEP